jgi:two-component system, NarL family, sensor histidine kinase DesK
VIFTVQDNGRGGTPREGNGLHGMRARIVEAGGTLAVDGSSGMRVTVTLPLKTPDAAIAS